MKSASGVFSRIFKDHTHNCKQGWWGAISTPGD